MEIKEAIKTLQECNEIYRHTPFGDAIDTLCNLAEGIVYGDEYECDDCISSRLGFDEHPCNSCDFLSIPANQKPSHWEPIP